MSTIYDNWGRLVGAVLKREEIWELCHAPSRSRSSSSISSDFSASSSSHVDDNSLRSIFRRDTEWVEIYEAGVYLTLAASIDGSIEVKRVRFSRRKFKEHEAKPRWLKNRDKVYEKYNVQTVEGSINLRDNEWVEQYEPGVYLLLAASVDGSTELKRARFRRGIFNEHGVEAWWLNNGEKVYEKIQARGVRK